MTCGYTHARVNQEFSEIATQHSDHKAGVPMPSRVFEITIPVINLPKTYALDRTANGINHTLTHTHTHTHTHTPR